MSQKSILKTTLAQTHLWGPHDDARILKSTFSADLNYLEIDFSADIQIGWLNYLEIDFQRRLGGRLGARPLDP